MVLELPTGRSSQFCRRSDSHFGMTWLTTTGPLTRVTVPCAKGKYGKSIIEQLHNDENMKIMHIHLRVFIRPDVSPRDSRTCSSAKQCGKHQTVDDACTIYFCGGTTKVRTLITVARVPI